MSTVLQGDARHLDSIRDGSIHLSVYSPPYNVDISYSKHVDRLPFRDYLKLLRESLLEVKRVTCSGGRICINVANTGRKPYVPLNAFVALIGLKMGLKMRGELIWWKGDEVVQTKTAWGSWRSCSNPVMRDSHEYVEVFSKDSYYLDSDESIPNDISRKMFLSVTKGHWFIPPTRVEGHPVPFPWQLPYRFIKMFTKKGMRVLDPFCGSGNTLIAAKKAGREYYGVDIDPAYVELARRRLEDLNLITWQRKVI